ncbi:MAG: hypothetical protein AB8G17_19330 [Gammaproteobacteria bacterium]
MEERDQPNAPVGEPLDENKPASHSTEAEQGGRVIIPNSVPDPTDSD